jgi:hypothetical protein
MRVETGAYALPSLPGRQRKPHIGGLLMYIGLGTVVLIVVVILVILMLRRG